MPTVELIYDRDCPNLGAARENLKRALKRALMPLDWREWDRADTAAPDYAKRYGSPTVLIDGRDAAGEPPSEAPSCRIYSNQSGHARGVPAVELLIKALGGRLIMRDGGKTGLMTALPAVGVALMPKLTCAACWPAYAALLGAMGVNFVDYTPYLLPAVALLLAATLWLIGWRAERRRGYKPLALGIVAAAVILIGKFAFDSDVAAYAGGALLFAAGVWNAWPRRQPAGVCAACETSGSTR